MHPPSTQAWMELKEKFNQVKCRTKNPLQCPFKIKVTQNGDKMVTMFCVDGQGRKIEELDSVSFLPNVTDPNA